MLNHVFGFEPGALAIFGVALLIGARSLRNRLQQSRTASATNAVTRAPESAAQLASLRRAA